ncbi:MAG: Mrr restriction system protein [Armatimonadia bacterium]|nr:Mrr restriction system protein [Armatimonadia bacterium]
MARKVPRRRIGELMQAVLTELRDVGGVSKPGALYDRVEKRLDLTDYERGTYDSGGVRWRAILSFHSIDCVKAQFIRKSGGKWHLTEEGEEALKLGPEEFIAKAIERYREWKRKQPHSDEVHEVDEDEIERQGIYTQARDQAQSEIEEHLQSLDPYDFQRLVAELLRAMGYHISSVAPPGPDGGIDITAYRDPLGTEGPRIKAQVKRHANKVGPKDVRELEGLLRKDGDVGLFVALSGFTSEAEREIRSSVKHIETMDGDRLVRLWQEHYEKLREPGKALMPLVKVHFLAPAETED